MEFRDFIYFQYEAKEILSKARIRYKKEQSGTYKGDVTAYVDDKDREYLQKEIFQGENYDYAVDRYHSIWHGTSSRGRDEAFNDLCKMFAVALGKFYFATNTIT